MTVQATLKDADGAPIPNIVISFSSADSALASLSPSSALTNTSGVAFSRIDATSIAAVGASYVNATATFPTGSTSSSTPVTAETPYAVGAATVDMTLAVSQANISAGGTSSVTATVSINGAAPTTPMTVDFTSGCARTGKATLSTGVLTINGVATATYTDNGCGQADTVVASTSSTQKTAVITVAPPQAANIKFIGTTPESSLLVIKGTGGVGYSETAVVKFQAVDAAGTGLANQTVRFGLTTVAGGLTMENTALAVGETVSKQTDANGDVSVTVQSGTVPTAVWVTAALGTLSTQSNKVVISTGRPSQDFFSLSATKLNIDGGNYDGARTTLNIYAADRLGNIVPDGTAINFIAEGAQIVGQTTGGTASSTCTTLNGACTVDLVSAEHRPIPDSERSGISAENALPEGPTANRVTVVAYTVGEESFVDANGNNKWDTGETWDDLGDIYIDSNESLEWDENEQFIRYSANNAAECPPLPTDTPKLDNATSKPGTCDGVWGQAHVRRSMVIVLSGHTAHANTNLVNMGGGCIGVASVLVSDQWGNPMPAGSTLTVSANAVSDSTAPTAKAAEITVVPETVPSSNAPGGTWHSVKVSVGAGKCATPVSGSFDLLVSTPSESTNVTSVLPFTVNP
ncbi:MAG: hypothetical protein A3H32_01150 [Betaproteobacteria bacterium RIFCSPLOWO2_02_FULL_63_19]|nr:MAG: hypothetical protein A3H32_01150 [Betaproteobacteria bacterium RIFCSPLOWO2_02_FULL_63_19]